MRRIVFLDHATLAPQTTLRRPPFPHGLAEHSPIARASDESQQTSAGQLTDTIEDFVAGRPTSLVLGTF